MKVNISISLEQARELIKQLSLQPGDSFSNPYPSDLCAEYRMETGYWLSFGQSRLVHLSTKEVDNQKVTTARLEINYESLGLSEEEVNEDAVIDRAKKILLLVYSITGNLYSL